MSEKNPNDIAQDIPEAEAKAEGQKLEWGPSLEPKIGPIPELITVEDAEKLLSEVNSSIDDNLNKWRLPTPDEITLGINAERLGVGIHLFLTSVDGSLNWDQLEFTNSFNGHRFPYNDEPKPLFVRLVRDVA